MFGSAAFGGKPPEQANRHKRRLALVAEPVFASSFNALARPPQSERWNSVEVTISAVM